MQVLRENDSYVIPCREWAAVHLGRNIKYQFRSKGNAWRAIRDPTRNLLTVMCYELMQVHTRLTLAEYLLMNIKNEVSTYEFDVVESDGHGGSAAGDGSVSGESDSVLSGPVSATVGGDGETASGA